MYSFQSLRGFSVSHKNTMVFSPFYNHPHLFRRRHHTTPKDALLRDFMFPSAICLCFCVCVYRMCSSKWNWRKKKFSYIFRSLVTAVALSFHVIGQSAGLHNPNRCEWFFCCFESLLSIVIGVLLMAQLLERWMTLFLTSSQQPFVLLRWVNYEIQWMYRDFSLFLLSSSLNEG